jgi:aldehyde:ferredoxin oxidoreductase
MKFVTIDMASGSIRTESVPRAYEGLGGRGLTSIMIDNEVPAPNVL